MKQSKSCRVSVIAFGIFCVLISPHTWAANNPVPHVDQPLVPASVKPGSVAFTLIVNGAGFASTSTLMWNASARTTTFVSYTQLKAQIKATDVAAAGTASITVTSAAPGGGISNVAFFQIETPASQVSLSNPSMAVGSGPAAVATADFNSDGNQDLAVANLVSNSVSILLGSGHGVFQPQVKYTTGLGPQDVAVGDFNGDGRLDLATVNAGEDDSGEPANTISVLIGNGDGTFQAHVDYATGELPSHLVVGDFNRDGFLDLATVNEDGQSLSVLLGNGNGTFQSHVDYSVGALPMGIVAADFNGDGILDLATANSESASVSILLGNGDGTFQPPLDYSVPTCPFGLVAADFNADGHQDLAVAVLGSASVAVLLGNGDGTFGNFVEYPTGTYPVSVVTGDFNGDGILDLALATDNVLGSLSVLMGNGNGSFQAALNFPAGMLPMGIAAGDFNGDGMLDLAAADFEGNTVSTMFQTTVLFSPTGLTFASQTLGTTSAAQSVTVSNIGHATLAISSIATIAPFAETNSCGPSLAPGANCTANVTYSPTLPGTITGSLSLSDGAIGSPQVVSLAGTGTGPLAVLSPVTLSFGSAQVGQNSSPQLATLTNEGNATLTITSITASGDYNISNGCGSTLAAAASCNINITFAPSASGTRTGTLTVADNAIGSPHTAALSGVGLQGQVSLSPSSLTFGLQLINTTSPPQTVTLTNTGNGSLTISRISASGSFTETNTCGSSVAAGAKCSISVTFTPAKAGTPTGTLTIADNAANNPQTVSLSGTGTTLSVSPRTLSWGTVRVGSSGSQQVVTLNNKGTFTVGSLSASMTGADPADFTETSTCSGSLSAGASCTYSVTFAPTATGSRTASLSISYGSSPGGSPQLVSLSGTGD